ncbi:MAG TPA: transcriptional repressor [Gammaproteobacteria bacterium]|nr:transcriptional repressor [Gammaproteobacteria bacterium]
METRSQLREQVTRKLLDSGINPTRQRLEIGVCLFEKDKHISADQVLELVNRGACEVSKATVYNTLGLFAERGLVRELVITPNKVVYDTNVSDHHHLYNVDTGDLQDLETDELHLNALPRLDDGVQIDGVDIIIRVKNKTPA